MVNDTVSCRTRPGDKSELAATFALDDVKIRAFESFDLQDCREIFRKCIEEWINDVLQVDLPRYCAYVVVESFFILFSLAFLWSFYTIGSYLVIVFITVLTFYLNAYYQGRKYVNRCLEADLKNIKNSYMIQSGSHMWVAVWRNKIIGMVGLLKKESYKPKIAELKRMYVLSTYRGKGVAGKLLERAVNYARIHHYDIIFLDTNSARKRAHRFYEKHGFHLVNVHPYPQVLPTNLQLYDFELPL